MNIVLDRICKSYGVLPVFSAFSHEFTAGRAHCISGPSGSGKTTLLRLVAGLEKPDSGKITGAESKKISAVFQEDRLFENLSAEKNVLLTAKPGFSRRDAAALLHRLGIADEKKRVAEFSGGMKRRCAIARALAADYDILILDEPLAGLDEGSRRAVLTVIGEENAGRTLLCATHLPDFEAFFSAERLEIPFTESAD